jgi:hypothetical protein
MRRAPSIRGMGARKGGALSRPRSLIALFASAAVLAGVAFGARAQTYTVVLSVNDSRPMGQAVLSLIRSYPITITYEDPRFEYAGDLQELTRQVSKTDQPNARTIVPKGGAFHAAYDVSQDTGEPVDMADAIQELIEANNRAREGGHFEVLGRGETFHVVPTEVRDSKGRWIAQRSVLDTPITFSSGGARDGRELIEAILGEVSDKSGQKIAAARVHVAIPCSGPACVESKRTIDARNEPARDVLMQLVSSLNRRYAWVLYYDASARYYVFNLVLGVERPEPNTQPYPQTQKPGNPTPGVPFNLASAR